MSESKVAGIAAGVFAVAGCIMAFDQVASMVPVLYPYQPTMSAWRYQAVALVVTRLTPLLFADALLIFAAVASGSRTGTRLLGALHLFLALVLAAAAAGFTLDALELRRMLQQEAKFRFLLNSARGVGMLGLAVLFDAWVGFRLLRAPVEPKDRAREDGRPLVVGGGARGVT